VGHTDKFSNISRLMKIALIIPTLNGGGAERVMSTMANYWESKGHEVVLITHDSEKKDFYPLNPGITRYGSDISGTLSGITFRGSPFPAG
jgi:GalNAc-alpha-(1->4)-GalNAc-alpha-(1->3)-diNAcBac-PP-undecaprenol alpha-1,4-N-acetyl-D-galactosaminyltransferase